MLRLSCLTLTFVLFACGDDGGSPPAIDAPTGGNNTVMAVTCPATPDATVMTSNFAWNPMNTNITVNQVVQFTTESIHNLVPDSAAGMTDPGLTVGFGETKCLKFTAAGTYNFKCSPHSFKGSVTVN